MNFSSLSSQARLQRASTLLKVGKLDEAAQDYTELVSFLNSLSSSPNPNHLSF